MELKSLGYQSELVFLHFDGKIEDRGSFLVMRTLTNPNYFWGNLLVYDRPPRKGDFKKWVEDFKREFTDPSIYHITLAWDSADGGTGDPSEFLENGFELEAKAVLSATEVHPPSKFNPELQMRILQSDQEWKEIVDLQVSSAHDDLPRSEWRRFYESQSERYKALTKAGRGEWYGGFLGGRLVAGLGIFHENGLGRFQIVCTHPEYQRQGLCGTLVYRSAQHAFSETKLKTLVMCADPDYHAINIYESVGFKKQQLEYGVYWWDQDRMSSFEPRT